MGDLIEVITDLPDRAVLLSIHRHLLHIRIQLDRMELKMTTQADIDALTTALTSDDAAIAQEIAALQAANPNLDLSGLQAAVAATAALVPAATAPVTAPTDPAAPAAS